LEEAVAQSDLIIVAVPVVAALGVIAQVLDLVDVQVVVDVGSTKKELCGKLAAHQKRSRFVASHPMWGTEFSGPKAASRFAFSGKAAVICNREQSDEDALKLVMEMYDNLGMHLLSMNAESHDVHTAYISHISHITSFALANTVLEKEREEDTIFEMASAGFESTVRLAKSNADTWVPIFRQNKENVLDVLNEHISQLRKFKASIEKENWGYLRELIEHANKINRILK
jgi:prephenate dehydrogenase